jgi:Domain of unknown function (DUF1905)
MIDLDVTFTAEVWMYHGKSAWFFVTLPKDESEQIKFFNNHKRRGWGSVRVKATIGETSWSTSIFPDSKAGAYLLPVKADVRKKEKIAAGDSVAVTLSVIA